jgi:nickel-dependent lactate racemase
VHEINTSLWNPIASQPLAELVRGKKSACILISDLTRPVPNSFILPSILEIIESEGIPRSRILILIATGIHRPSTEKERAQLVGPVIAKNYRIIDHHSKRVENMVEVGKIQGRVPVLINSLYVEADLKILTGFIEAHMWAGYSGGRKSILPGICSIEPLEFMHGAEMIAHPKTRYGALKDNPFHEAGLEVMEKASADFLVNMTLNTRKEITGVFSGHPVTAHLKGCDFFAQHCIHELDTPLGFMKN